MAVVNGDELKLIVLFAGAVGLTAVLGISRRQWGQSQ